MARTDKTARGIIIKDNKILLIHRLKKGEEYFVLPGGGIEDDETPEVTVKREIYEETGLKVISLISDFKIVDVNGQDSFIYYLKLEDGIPELVGEEKEYSHPDDWYNPEWFDIDILNQTNVYPVAARQRILEDLKHKKTSPK